MVMIAYLKIGTDIKIYIFCSYSNLELETYEDLKNLIF